MVNTNSISKMASLSIIDNNSIEFFFFFSIDLNFDWIANIIGWIESKESSIRSFSVNSQITDTIYANLQNPAFLTIDPHFG